LGSLRVSSMTIRAAFIAEQSRACNGLGVSGERSRRSGEKAEEEQQERGLKKASLEHDHIFYSRIDYPASAQPEGAIPGGY